MRRWMKRHKILTGLFGLVVLLCSGEVRADEYKDWERLPDGRVVIEIFDHKLAFATHGDALSGTQFDFSAAPESYWPYDPIGHLQKRATLGEVMTYYKEAQEVIAEIKQKDGGSIRLMLDPNSINPKDHPVFDFKGRMPDELSWIKFYPKSPGDLTPYDLQSCKYIEEPDDDGFGLEKKTRNKRTYCAPASARNFKASRPLRIYCHVYGNEWFLSSCTLPEYSNAKRTIVATYNFTARGLEEQKNDAKKIGFTKDQWLALDKRVHDFLTHLIISETAESIQ